MFTQKVAQQIVEKTMDRIGRNVNIMDEKGTIIASGDLTRIGKMHEGAVQVLASKQPFYIYEEQQLLQGSQPGINLPIYFHGELKGVVGITGNPEEIKELGSLVVMSVELLIESALIQEEREWKIRTIGFTLEECLKGNPNHREIQQKLQLLNMTVSQPIQLFIFELSESGQGFFNLEWLRQFFEDFGDYDAYLFNWTSENELTILIMGKAINQSGHPQRFLQKLEQLLGKSFRKVRVAWDAPVMGLDNLSLIHGRLKKTLALSEGKQVRPDQFSLELLLSEISEQAVKRVTLELKPLRLEQLETLQALFAEDLILSKTAKRLFIHRNTLLYRLDQITDLTGRDPRSFEDALYLSTLIKLKRLNDLHNNL